MFLQQSTFWRFAAKNYHFFIETGISDTCYFRVVIPSPYNYS